MSDEELKSLDYGKKGESDFEAGSSKSAQYGEGSTVLVNPIFKKKEKTEAELIYEDMTEEERAMIEKMAARDAQMEEHELTYDQIHDDTATFLDYLNQLDPYPAILSVLKEGHFTAELKKRYMIKAIDENWVKVVEDSLVALDAIIRRPTKFIEQNEQLLPIELSKNISSRSIQHLSQHTNLISSVEGDDITPTKILNVFNDETMQTYENKFVNTLLNRLYIFIAKRYDAVSREGSDQKYTRMNFTGDFKYGTVKGKINFGVEVSEAPEEKVQLKNVLYTSDIWKRVEKLFSIVKGYTTSEFAVAMGKSFIRPPVMHTNAILKNKNLRQCLALYEFIESYEDIGFEMLVSEDAEAVNDAYIEELYRSSALLYINFRHSLQDDVASENALLNSVKTEEAIRPKFVTDIKPVSPDEFDIHEVKYEDKRPQKYPPQEEDEPIDQATLDAIEIAIAADIILEEQRELAYKERLRREAEERKRNEDDKARLRKEAAKRKLAEKARILFEEEQQKTEAEAELLRAMEEQSAQEEARKQKEKEEKAARKKTSQAIVLADEAEANREAEDLFALLGMAKPQTLDFISYTEYIDNWKKPKEQEEQVE